MSLYSSERDKTLLASACSQISYGLYPGALKTSLEIEDSTLRDQALEKMANSAISYGLYKDALSAIDKVCEKDVHVRCLKKLAQSATSYGQYEWAKVATDRMQRGPKTRQSRTTGMAITNQEVQDSPTSSTSKSAVSQIKWPALVVTIILWAISLNLHKDRTQWLTGQLDNLSMTTFLITAASLGAFLQDWLKNRR